MFFSSLQVEFSSGKHHLGNLCHSLHCFDHRFLLDQCKYFSMDIGTENYSDHYLHADAVKYELGVCSTVQIFQYRSCNNTECTYFQCHPLCGFYPNGRDAGASHRSSALAAKHCTVYLDMWFHAVWNYSGGILQPDIYQVRKRIKNKRHQSKALTYDMIDIVLKVLLWNRESPSIPY